jgi:uncharacterized protein YhaN
MSRKPLISERIADLKRQLAEAEAQLTKSISSREAVIHELESDIEAAVNMANERTGESYAKAKDAVEKLIEQAEAAHEADRQLLRKALETLRDFLPEILEFAPTPAGTGYRECAQCGRLCEGLDPSKIQHKGSCDYVSITDLLSSPQAKRVMHET